MGSNREWSAASTPGAKYQWHTVRTIDGVKVLRHKESKNAALPLYSHKDRDMYFRENSKGRIVQLRIYRGKHAHIDIDWTHGHGKLTRESGPHIHIYRMNPYTGSLEKATMPFSLSKYFLNKYGRLLQKADPDVKIKKQNKIYD